MDYTNIQQLVTQQGQTRKDILINPCDFVSGTYVNLNNIQSNFKTVITHGRGDFIISYSTKSYNSLIIDVRCFVQIEQPLSLLRPRGEKLMDDYLLDWKYSGLVELHLSYLRDIRRRIKISEEKQNWH